MTLQHQLRLPSLGIPELHSPVLTTGHHPIAMRCEGYREHEVLMTLKGPNTLSALRATLRGHIVKLPHADGLVQRAGNKIVPIRRESNRVNAILVPLFAFRSLNKVRGLNVPDSHALVETTGCDVARVGRDCDRRDSVFYLKAEDALVLADVP